MATRLQAARQARDLSQRQVITELLRRASAAGIAIASPSSLKVMLSNYENGRREVQEPYRSLFRAIFGMTDDELFGVSPETGTGGDPEAYVLAERVAAAKRVDANTAQVLSRQTDLLRTMDCQLGGAPLVDQMAAHLETIQTALTHAILPSVRQPLAAVLADAAALAAWQALDVGAVNRAWQYHETARYAALEARDPVLLTHAMAQQAFVLVDIGEVQAAVELVREASREAGTAVPERFRAWLDAAEAEVHAAAGDELNCRRSLDTAMGRLPHGTDATDPDMPFIVLNDAHLARWGGHALARLGEAEALDHLYRALAENGVVSTRAEAALRCDIANAHLIRGERDEARTNAFEARRLARRCGSVRQRRRVDQLALIA